LRQLHPFRPCRPLRQLRRSGLLVLPDLSAQSRRPRLLASIDRILDHGNRHQKDRDQGQSGLFGGEMEADNHVADDAALPAVAPWTETEALGFEKEALGLYMSGHPLQRYAETLATNGITRLADLTQSEADISIPGVV